MTENQAKEKWCPMVRSAGIYNGGKKIGPGVNRIHFVDGGDLSPLTLQPYAVCIGSGCMMWRWSWDELDQGRCGLAGNEERGDL